MYMYAYHFFTIYCHKVGRPLCGYLNMVLNNIWLQCLLTWLLLKCFQELTHFFIPRVMEDNGTLKKSLSCRYLLYKRIIYPLFCTMFCTMHIFPPICTHESFLFRRIVKFLVLTFWYCVDPTNSGKRGPLICSMCRDVLV